MPAFDFHIARPLLLLIAMAFLSGCASTAERTPGDPLEPMNRGIHAFNDGLDRAILKPTAKAYVKVTPDWLQTGVDNFFNNLFYPTTIVNQLLQGKIRLAGQDTLRLVLNTIWGLGGVIDVATPNNLPIHDEDFGQTLGWWGVPPGPYLVIPLLGPANIRDAPSRVADSFLQPFYWYDSGNERWFSLALQTVNRRARLLPLDATLDGVYDQYAFIRDAFTQRRQFVVYDGNPPEEPLDEFDEFDEFDESEFEGPAPEDVGPGESGASDPVRQKP
jgi:phospholipid-binding lipoprotein MlaA